MPFSYEFHFLVMFLSKSKSIMTTKGMSLLARGSKGNWELLASILVVGKRIPKHSDFVLVFGECFYNLLPIMHHYWMKRDRRKNQQEL